MICQLDKRFETILEPPQDKRQPKIGVSWKVAFLLKEVML